MSTKLTLCTLPIELISRIFTLSFNPALVVTCRALYYTLSPLSKSVYARIEFLLYRYRNNYIKAVIKGSRWKFFDLNLLNGLDRIYIRERDRLREANTRNQLNLQARGLISLTAFADTASDQSYTPTPSSSRASSPPFNTSRIHANTGTPSNRPQKKQKKYQIPEEPQELQVDTGLSMHQTSPQDDLESRRVATHDSNLIPLPDDFSMPRRLFKSHDYLDLILTLLERGASPSQPSSYPLVRASQRGDVDMVKALLRHGAPPDQKALRWACVEEHDAVLDLFLEVGVKPDETCLAWCVEKGKTRMIDRLLKLGVVPNMKTLLDL